jgi:hypothetical protein
LSDGFDDLETTLRVLAPNFLICARAALKAAAALRITTARLAGRREETPIFSISHVDT